MDQHTIAQRATHKIFRNFQIATMDPEVGEPYGVLRNSTIEVDDRGKILSILSDSDRREMEDGIEIIDGENDWLTPGLIDCHTHLVYGGCRADEWEARLTGSTYEEIARGGGGILSTVKNTRAASDEDLINSASNRLSRLRAEGVTTVEIKSGYGLDLETELRMLQVAHQLEKRSGIRVEKTLLAAHAVPSEFSGRADDYLDLVCQEIIPAAKNLCTAVDAFCETIAFDVEQTQRVFEAAQAAGLQIKIHAEQLSHTGIAAIAAKMGALSADHLEYLTAKDCETLASCGTVATLLPGAFYCLRETQVPPVEALLENKVPVAIATDCNPGSSPVTSLLLMANMACNLFDLSPEQAFAGITRLAARALGLQDSVGIIRPGMRADFAVWDVESPAEIIFGVGHNPCVSSFRNGTKTSA